MINVMSEVDLFNEHLAESKTADKEVFPSTHFLAYFHRRKARKKASHKKIEKFNYKGSYKAQKILQKDVNEESKQKDREDYVDPIYFKELKGRILKERFSIRQYINDTREVLGTRLLTGQERDECIRIDQQFEEEQKRLEKIKKKYLLYVKCFEEFLAKDHAESMRVLSEANKEENKTLEITAKRNKLSKEYGQVRLEVYFWEEAWRMVKQCQKFLYLISPLSWREEHDWVHKDMSTSTVVSRKSADLFSSHKIVEDETSLVSLIDMFQLDLENAGPPELYFEDPLDLIRVFRTIELQNLNAMIHLESLAGPMADMAVTISMTEERIKSEMNEIVEGIKDLEEAIRAAEERAASLEKYANQLLYGVFRDLVCSEQVLYLRVFIEDTYEACVGPNDANLDSFMMMRSIEKAYEDLNIELDNLPHEVVVVCEKKGFREEMKVLREAEDAARKFELMHRLLAALKRIMEPPKPKKRQLMCRSTPKERKPKPVAQLPPPTDQEQNYLHFFTNYCPQDNPSTFRDQLPDDFDLSLKNKRSQEADTINDNKKEENCPFFI